MSERNLRNVLRIDAVGSGLSTVFTLAGASWLGARLEVSAWIPFAVGLVLIPWVALLIHTVRRHPLSPAEVAVIVAGNVGWAVAAGVLIFGFPDAMSATGNWMVGLFSLAVLALGVAQWVGLRSLVPGGHPAAA